jgi:hypothetical protein
MAARPQRPHRHVRSRWGEARCNPPDKWLRPPRLPRLEDFTTWNIQLTSVIIVANRGLYSTLVLLLHFFTWERQPLGEEEKKHVFPPFRAERECSLEMDAIGDTATPTEAQAIPWSAGIKFHCRDPEALQAWIASEET